MDHLTYAARLLAAAHSHRQYRSVVSDMMVSASIIQRLVDGTPLNDKEAEAFAWVLANPCFVDRMCDFVEEARIAGHTRLSGRLVVERARWETILGAVESTDEYLINDHTIPYLSRMVNEVVGVPFFTARSVEGEPGHGHAKEAQRRRRVLPELPEAIRPEAAPQARREVSFEEEFLRG